MYRCKICGKKYTELAALYNHIETKHKDMIPKDMSVQQYYYYMKTGKMNGNCVMCKKPTSWNHNTGKYNRFCGDEKCKEEYVKIMKSRMVAKYGKTHLLNDPNKQREMLANRSISGVYKWSDGKHETTYTGSYELDFLKTLDGFFNWDPEDISMPSPHTYTYKYEGEDKFYIPDVFIHSLDLEIEIKDGGDNPNNHYKIQAVDKHKEALKDEVMCSQKAFHYIKITNKNYENFFSFLKEIKREFEKHEDEKKIPRIFKIEDIKGTNVKPVKESVEVVKEGNELIDDIQKGLAKFDKFTKVKYSERDMFFSLRYDLAKNNPKEMQEYLSKLIKAAQFEDDLHYVRKMARKADDHYRLKLKKNPDLKDEYEKYYDWFKNGGMDKDIKKKSKKVIKESMEIVEENIFVSTDNIELHLDKFGHSENVMYITGLGGSGKSTIISKYCKEYGADALEFDAVTSALIRGLENLNRNKIHPIILEYLETQNPNKLDGFSDPNFIPESVKFLDWFESRVKGDKKLYIIEGMQLFICFEPERFIGKPMVIMGTSVSKSMFRSVCRVYKRSEGDVIRTFKFFLKTLKRIPVFLKNDRQLSDMINVLDESYITDIMEESSISIPQMSYYLQNQYEEDMKDYLNTYKKYYNLMLKEQPAAVKHINEDIRKCLIVIDGLADKGVENNLVQFAKDDLGEIVKAAKHGKPVKVIENTEYVKEKFEIDKFLVWLDKPIMKAKNANIRLYHVTPGWDMIKDVKYTGKNDGIIWNKGDIIKPDAINMGVTNFSEIRQSIYCWDNIENSKRWGIARTLILLKQLTYQFLDEEECLLKDVGIPATVKMDIPVCKPKDLSITDLIDYIMSCKPFYYIYEFEVPVSILELGGAGNNKEYTVSEPLTVLKRHKIFITKQDLLNNCVFLDIEDTTALNHITKSASINKNYPKYYKAYARKGILGLIADGHKDAYRFPVYDLIHSGKIKGEDDIKNHSKTINKNIAKLGQMHRDADGSYKTFGLSGHKKLNPEDLLRENMVEDMVNINDSNNDINSITVQDDNVSISNIVECKLVYNNPNSKQLFSLTDVKSQLIIENSYVIQRDKVGTHCSVSPVYTDLEEENVLEFQLVLNEGVDIHTLNSKLSEGVVITSLHKFDDDNFRFIKESCLKLFGVYPKEIKIK